MDTQNNNMKKYPMSAQEATDYLTSAIYTKDDEKLNLCLKDGGYSALQLSVSINDAINHRNENAVKHLVAHAVREYPEINLINCLKAAIKGGLLKAVEYMLLHCKFDDKHKYNIFQSIVSQYGIYVPELVNLLMKHGFFDPAKHNDYNFAYEAIKNGHVEIIKQLLEHGMSADMINKRCDVTGLNLLHVACKHLRSEIAKMLVEHKADVNSLTTGKYEAGNSCLYYSVFYNDVDLASFLLENGAELDDDPNFFNMIDNAIRCYYSDMLTMLFKRTKNINVVNECNETFLHSCCSLCNHEKLDFRYKWAEYLIKNGADVNVRARSGNTPIFDAVRNKFYRMTNLFLKNNAYLHDIDKNGSNLLHLAVKYSDLEFIQTLLNQNVDVNHENKKFETPLSSGFKLPRNNYKKSRKIDLLLKHIIKLKCSGFFVNRRDLHYIYEKHHPDTDFDVDRFEFDCKNEIEELKNEKIGISGLSLYDVLVKTDRTNAKYVRNEIFIVLLTSEAVERKFPIYINLIRNQIRLAELRRNMLEMARKYVVFTDLQKLPDVCVNEIFNNLSTLELNRFISVINPLIKVERSNLRACNRI